MNNATKIILAVLAGIALVFIGGGTPAQAEPSSYETAWSSPLNQASYWSNLLGMECKKYESHNGHIPAKYDAAIIKDGSSVVKVYPDLSNTGSFTATGAINPNNGKPYSAPHSWVMKCDAPQPPPTTVPPTTEPPVISKLGLTYNQDCAPDDLNTWRIRPVDVKGPVAWELQNAPGTYSGTMNPGDGEFVVEAPRGNTTAKLFYDSDGNGSLDKQTVKASGPDLTPESHPELFEPGAKCGPDVPPTTEPPTTEPPVTTPPTTQPPTTEPPCVGICGPACVGECQPPVTTEPPVVCIDTFDNDLQDPNDPCGPPTTVEECTTGVINEFGGCEPVGTPGELPDPTTPTPPAMTELPATGTATTAMAWIAAIALMLGISAWGVARRKAG